MAGDDVSLSQEPKAPPAPLGEMDRRYLKQVYDNVHGNVQLDPVLISIPTLTDFSFF